MIKTPRMELEIDDKDSTLCTLIRNLEVYIQEHETSKTQIESVFEEIYLKLNSRDDQQNFTIVSYLKEMDERLQNSITKLNTTEEVVNKAVDKLVNYLVSMYPNFGAYLKKSYFYEDVIQCLVPSFGMDNLKDYLIRSRIRNKPFKKKSKD